LISLVAKIPCGGHGTANSAIKLCAANVRSIAGFDAVHSLRAAS
jgi:hypothetical protein